MDNNNLMNNNNQTNYTYEDTSYTVINDQPSGDGKGMAIASMVLGICACSLFWCYGIVAVVLGIIGLVLACIYKKQHGKLKGMALAGFITSIVGLVLGILVILYFVCVIAFWGNVMSGFLGSALR